MAPPRPTGLPALKATSSAPSLLLLAASPSGGAVPSGASSRRSPAGLEGSRLARASPAGGAAVLGWLPQSHATLWSPCQSPTSERCKELGSRAAHWAGRAGSRSGPSLLPPAAMVPSPASQKVSWDQLHPTVKAGTMTLADRLADRGRDRECELPPSFQELLSPAGVGGRAQHAWVGGAGPQPKKLREQSPRTAKLLAQTEQLNRLFSPAPCPELPRAGTPTRGSPKNAAGGKGPGPPARSSLSITKGCRLAQLIESGYVGLVRSSYFEDCLLHNRPLAMRQLIPNSFMWRGDEAVNLWWQHGKCFLCVVSYSWLSKDHPDPNQFHLRKLVRILDEYKKIWNMHEVAVILDYCSLWQRSARGDTRTAEQREQFNQGIREINVPYAHKAVTTIKLVEVPKGEPRKYDDRGWTLLEAVLTDSKGGDWNRWTFNELDPESTQWADPVVFFMQAKSQKLQPPLTPQGFARELDLRRQRAKARDVALFTVEQDNEEVHKRYAEMYLQITHSTKLSYDNADWSDDDLALLLEVVASCDRLEKLQLNHNRISLRGASEIAKVVAQLPALKWLGLQGNPLCRDSQATDLLRLVWAKERKPAKNLLL